ncbi:MAG: hypothetical protein S4CHLAM37_05560 [Chlamydiia bacterium]|nr:hypothetical protein [Chlamydiia bacterium]
MHRLLSFIFFLGLSFFLHGSTVDDSECVAFVSNKNYFYKFLKTLEQLTTKGKYNGDICLIIGDDLENDQLLQHPKIIQNNVIVKHFPDIRFNKRFFRAARKLPRFNLLFQYHKLHLFNTFFKKWNYVFYIDSGMEIYSDITPILDSKKAGKLLAQSDAYPSYVWKLSSQFSDKFPIYTKALSKKFDMETDYFQTGTMLYDTNIISSDTFNKLAQLAMTYPSCNTNDQGICALYFTKIQPVWEPLPFRNKDTYFYDAMKRGRKGPFIMIKWPHYN